MNVQNVTPQYCTDKNSTNEKGVTLKQVISYKDIIITTKLKK